MQKRIDSLNFIRILGMSMILLFHAWLSYGFSTGCLWLDQIISIGAIFVTVFFMLSGFGLRKSNRDLSCEDSVEMKKYYKKRFLSIYPLFFLLTIVALIFQFRVMEDWWDTLIRLPIQFSMLHILLGKEMHGFLFNDNCWYISALFVLYLLFPFINKKINHWSTRTKIIMCVFLWLLSTGVYFYCVYFTKLTFLDYYPNPFLRIPEFMIGMMVADLSEEVAKKNLLGNTLKSNLVCSVFFIVVAVFSSLCILALRPHFGNETNLYGILVIPCTVIVFLVMANWDWANRMGNKPVIRWMAGLGLEMYLCQSFAMLVLARVKVDGQWDELVFIGLSVVFAVVVNTVFTKMIMKRARM